MNILTVFEVTVSRSHCQTFFKGTADYVHFNSENRQWQINYLKSALKPTFLTSNKQDPAVKIPTGASVQTATTLGKKWLCVWELAHRPLNHRDRSMKQQKALKEKNLT